MEEASRAEWGMAMESSEVEGCGEFATGSGGDRIRQLEELEWR